MSFLSISRRYSELRSRKVTLKKIYPPRSILQSFNPKKNDMNPTIRAAIWLVPLAVGCMALPPQLQADLMSGGKMKYRRAKAPSYFNEEESSSSVIASSSDENSIGPTTITNVAKISNGTKNVDAIISNPLPPRGVVSAAIQAGDSITTLSSSSSSSVASSSTATPAMSSSVELASPTGGLPSSTLSIAEAKTELGGSLPSASNRGTTTTRTTMKMSTTAINTSGSNLTTFPTEASSRTIASNRDASTFLPSSKKSTTSFNEITTTPASTSSKEMRESTGKIRPQIKLTMNYTNLGEVSKIIISDSFVHFARSIFLFLYSLHFFRYEFPSFV